MTGVAPRLKYQTHIHNAKTDQYLSGDDDSKSINRKRSRKRHGIQGCILSWKLAITRSMRSNLWCGTSSRRNKILSCSTMIPLIVLSCLILHVYKKIHFNHGAAHTISENAIRSTSATNDSNPVAQSFQPRVVGYYFDEDDKPLLNAPRRLNPYDEVYRSFREIELDERTIKRMEKPMTSRDYRHGARDEFIQGDCVAMHDWQMKSHPSCNNIHETTLTGIISDEVKLVTHGYWRDVWLTLQYDGTPRVLKTLRYSHSFEDRNYDRHRRDAVAMERLTSSQYVVDIYGFCGNSASFEFSEGGDLDYALWPKHGTSTLTMLDKLNIAVQVANGLVDVHDTEKDGRPTIAHTDISTGQFLLMNGKWKLNDFNRCRFIRWNEQQQKPCTYRVGNNPGKFRSPEEYEYAAQTEKVDVYSMGNIFYSLLTESWPYDDEKDKVLKSKIIAGKRPELPPQLEELSDPAVMILRKAMEICWTHNPVERASSLEVRDFLNKEKNNLPWDYVASNKSALSE